MEEFRQHGTWIYIDPDAHIVECIDKTLDLETLCDLLRCDATDLKPLGGAYLGFVDGGGAWQERQAEWEFKGVLFWGPMIIFNMSEDELEMNSCTEEDLETIAPLVKFRPFGKNTSLN